MSENAKILIVDDEPWILHMVRTVLSRRGYQVETARDGEEALGLARAAPPDLIITDILMPGMDGWALVRALRSHHVLALVPVIFLTALDSEEDRILGFRLGADDYLQKPFRYEELDLRVKKALRVGRLVRQQASRFTLPPEPGARPGIQGNLADLGLCGVLTMLEMERKTGVLEVQGDATGRIYLRDGTPLRATVAGDPPVRGAEAVYALLTWTSGSFRFLAMDLDIADEIGMATTHLLMEAARRIDERVAG